MTLLDLLEKLAADDVALEVRGDSLRVSAPEDADVVALRRSLLDQKLALRSLLTPPLFTGPGAPSSAAPHSAARALTEEEFADWDERSAIVEYEAGYPRSWAEVLAALQLGLFCDRRRRWKGARP